MCVKVWFSNRRARLRKQMSSSTSSGGGSSSPYETANTSMSSGLGNMSPPVGGLSLPNSITPTSNDGSMCTPVAGGMAPYLHHPHDSIHQLTSVSAGQSLIPTESSPISLQQQHQTVHQQQQPQQQLYTSTPPTFAAATPSSPAALPAAAATAPNPYGSSIIPSHQVTHRVRVIKSLKKNQPER